MADSNLTALPEVTTSADADLLYTVQGGNSRKTTRGKVIAPAVRHDAAQTLDDTAKARARSNISAASLVNGLVPLDELPDELFGDIDTVDSEAEMLALDVPKGSIAVRTDVQKNFILKAVPASEITNWVELATPTAPVTSVNSKTGNVVLGPDDIDESGNLAQLAALELVANKILNTDASGDLTQSDITAAALVLLKLAGTAAANKFPYFNGADEAALADLTSQARTMLASTTPAVTSLGYTPVNKAGDTMTGNLGSTGFSMTGATDGSHYVLSNLQTVTIVQDNPFIAWNFSGVMLITNWLSGGTIAMVCGGGNIGIAFQVGTHNTADFIYASDQSGYAFYNRGPTANFSVTLIRTRDVA